MMFEAEILEGNKSAQWTQIDFDQLIETQFEDISHRNIKMAVPSLDVKLGGYALYL